MPDPGTALAVTSLIRDVGKDLYDYYKAWRDCEKEVAEVRDHLLWLQRTFEDVKLTLERQGLAGQDRDKVESAVLSCQEAYKELHRTLDKIRREAGNPQTLGQKLKTNMKTQLVRSSYPFKKATINGLMKNIETCRHALHFVMDLLGLNALATTLEMLHKFDEKLTLDSANHENVMQQLLSAQTTANDKIDAYATKSQASLNDAKSAVLTVQDLLLDRHDRLENMLKDEKDERKAERIITSLDKAELQGRKYQIPEAHGQTYEWIFTGQGSEKDETGISDRMDVDDELQSDKLSHDGTHLQAPFLPECRLAHWLESVSYTHLTLPTKRIV